MSHVDGDDGRENEREKGNEEGEEGEREGKWKWRREEGMKEEVEGWVMGMSGLQFFVACVKRWLEYREGRGHLWLMEWLMNE